MNFVKELETFLLIKKINTALDLNNRELLYYPEKKPEEDSTDDFELIFETEIKKLNKEKIQ